MKIWPLFIMLIISQSLMADRRVDLINLLNEEIDEVTRLNKQVSSRNPNLLLRLAELYLERARVHKEVENEKFLEISIENRGKADKKKIFVKSQQDFLRAQKICYFIVKNFNKFKGVADVYYILAFNAKEFGEDSRAQKYFSAAVKKSSKESTTAQKSKLALAELYYNKKDYHRAIPYYEDSIKSRSSRWWTKDAYNLAWCYFRTNKLNQAITTMKEIERLSGDSKYVDLSKDAQRDLALFYTEAGRTNEAVSYYQKGGKDVAANFLRVAKNLISQKKYTQAEKVLTEAKKHFTSEEQKIAGNQMMIEAFEYLDRPDQLPGVLQEQIAYMNQGKLNEEQKKFIIYVVDRFSGVYQKQVVSKRYAHAAELNRKKAEFAVTLFDIKAKLDPSKAHVSYLLAGETYYSINDCNKAITYYEKASAAAKDANDAKVRTQAGNGIMVCMSDDSLDSQTRDKYLIPVYRAYLNENPSGEKSQKIYQRLFVEQMKKNDLAAADQTFEQYRKYFPNESAQHEAFLAKLIDASEKSKNNELANKWLTKIYNKEIPVSQKFRDGAKSKLMKIQFAQIGERKDNVSVLKGYLAVYNNQENTQDTRAIAAYNIAGKYYELSYYQKTYVWVERAVSLLNDADIQKFKSDLMTMIGHVSDGLEFALGAKLQVQFAQRFCRKDNKDAATLLVSAMTLYSAEGNFDEALKVMEQIKTCVSAPEQNGAFASAARVYIENADLLQNYKAMEHFLMRFGNDQVVLLESIQAHFNLAEIFLKRADSMGVKKHYADGLAKFELMKKSGSRIPMQVLEWVAKSKLSSLRKAKEELESLRLSFPEERFQRDIKQKIKLLDEVVSKGKEVIDLNAPLASMTAREYMIEAHNSLAEEVDQFEPPGKSEEYLKSFKANMSALAGPLKAQARALDEKLREQITTANLLSARNKKIILNAPDRMTVAPSINDYVMMEREAK